LSVAEAQQGSEQHVMVGEDVILLPDVVADPAFDYVALGHIHKHQDLNLGNQPPVVYAGSLERIDFGEETERKGFVVADVCKGHTDYQFVPVHARPFVTIRVDANVADPMSRILHEIERHDIVDAVVRVLIEATEEVEPMIDERPIRQALHEAHYISAIRKHIHRPHRHRLNAETPEELSPSEALQKYFEAKDLPDDRIKTLMGYAEEILEEE
jgi:exonuclease SbcD